MINAKRQTPELAADGKWTLNTTFLESLDCLDARASLLGDDLLESLNGVLREATDFSTRKEFLDSLTDPIMGHPVVPLLKAMCQAGSGPAL